MSRDDRFAAGQTIRGAPQQRHSCTIIIMIHPSLLCLSAMPPCFLPLHILFSIKIHFHLLAERRERERGKERTLKVTFPSPPHGTEQQSTPGQLSRPRNARLDLDHFSPVFSVLRSHWTDNEHAAAPRHSADYGG